MACQLVALTHLLHLRVQFLAQSGRALVRQDHRQKSPTQRVRRRQAIRAALRSFRGAPHHLQVPDPEMKVSAAAIGRLLEESATRPGTLDFGLQLAEQRTVANLGALACGGPCPLGFHPIRWLGEGV